MTKAAKAVLADALRLGENERAELAAEVLASLDGPGDPGAEAAWEAEIRRRIDAIDAGAMELEPWDAVRGESKKRSWVGESPADHRRAGPKSWRRHAGTRSRTTS